MKLIPVSYFGFTAMDRRFSSPMLPWIVAEIRKRDFSEKLSLGIEDGIIQAYNPDFELQFSHKAWQMTRFSQADQDPTTFLYVMRDDHDTLLFCYLFQAKTSQDVLHVIDRILDPFLATSNPNPTALDLIRNWNLGYHKIRMFESKIRIFEKSKIFAKPSGHTFFIPIDSSTSHFQNIDSDIIDSHVVPNVVLFTRPSPKNFVYETLANGEEVYIVVLMTTVQDRTYIKSHTVIGNEEHRKGEVLAEILVGDIPVTNGVVHLISTPLATIPQKLKLFPYLSIWYKISSDPLLNETYHFGQVGGVNKALRRGKEYFTYFAPINKAWSNFTGYSKYEMGEILSRHLVLNGRYSIANLGTKSLTLETLAGQIKLKIVRVNETVFLCWGDKFFEVVRPDYMCSNGVVHLIDGIFAVPKMKITTSNDGSFWKKLKDLVT